MHLKMVIKWSGFDSRWQQWFTSQQKFQQELKLQTQNMYKQDWWCERRKAQCFCLLLKFLMFWESYLHLNLEKAARKRVAIRVKAGLNGKPPPAWCRFKQVKSGYKLDSCATWWCWWKKKRRLQWRRKKMKIFENSWKLYEDFVFAKSITALYCM